MKQYEEKTWIYGKTIHQLTHRCLFVFFLAKNNTISWLSHCFYQTWSLALYRAVKTEKIHENMEICYDWGHKHRIARSLYRKAYISSVLRIGKSVGTSVLYPMEDYFWRVQNTYWLINREKQRSSNFGIQYVCFIYGRYC